MLAQAVITREPPRIDLRREQRHVAEAGMALRPFGADAVEARLINISSNGFMAEADVAIEPGARVWLSLPGVPRASAVVLWSRGSRIGGEFAEPIDPLIVLQAIGRQSSPS